MRNLNEELEEPFSDKGIDNKIWIKGLNQLVKTQQLMEERLL